MASRRGDRGWLTHLTFLFTCLLLITGGTQARKLDKMETEGEGGDSGGEEDSTGEGRGGGVNEAAKKVELGVTVAENGTTEAVVLDCPYQLEEDDLQGVAITWFHMNSKYPVYQWIPTLKPQAMQLLEGRVDLKYEASTDTLHRHRAIRILNPTTELAGRYRCRVSSLTTEVSYTHELVVFREPSALDVWVEAREEGKVTVFCKVEEVYPQPVLHLHQKSSTNSEVLKGGTPVTSYVGETYNMKVEKVVEEATLDGPTEFECEMTIPKTDVQVVRSAKYQPRVSVTMGAVIGGSSTHEAPAVLLTVLSILACIPYH